MVNPIFHISGFSILMRAIISGCTLIIHNKFDTKHVLDVIEQQKVTHTSFVPVMLSRIMSDENVRKKDLSSLRSEERRVGKECKYRWGAGRDRERRRRVG